MTAVDREDRPIRGWASLAPATALVVMLALVIFRERLPALADYPQNLVIPFKDWLGAAMVWLKVNFTWATRSLTWLIDFPLRLAFNLLAKGFKFGAGEAATTLPRLSWYGITLVMA